MGNFITCCHVDNQTLKLIDFRGNLRLINDPITVAEIMLEEPGHLISPVVNLSQPFRLCALRADEELIAGNVYMLIATNRVHSMVSKSELEMLKSSCKRSQSKRRSSKVLSAATERRCDGDESEGSGEVLGQNDVTGFTGYQVGSCKQWKPVLEPIYEGI